MIMGQRNSSLPLPSPTTVQTTEVTTIAVTTTATTTATTASTSATIQSGSTVSLVRTSAVTATASARPSPTRTAQSQGSSSQNAFMITGIVVGSAIVIAGIFIFLFRKFGLSPSKDFKNRLRQSFSPAKHSGSSSDRNAPFAPKPSIPKVGGGFAVYETTEMVPIESTMAQPHYGNTGYQDQYYGNHNGYEYGYNGSEIGYQHQYENHSQAGYNSQYDQNSVGYQPHVKSSH